MLDTKQLRQLIALYELGTVTAAAEHLHMSQPSLTAHLNRLESVMGNKLFLRSAKGLEATPLGTSLYHRGKAMLAKWNQFDSEIKLLAGSEKGEIRIVCGAAVEQGVLPQVCVEFLQNYPGIILEVNVYNPLRMINIIRNCEADIAIGSFPVLQGVDCQQINMDEQFIGFFVRPGHPLLSSLNWIEDLHHYPMATPQIPLESDEWSLQHWQGGINRTLATDSYVLLKQVAQHTDHVIGGPSLLFEADVAQGVLIQLPLAQPPRWNVSLLVSRTAMHSRIIANFVACVKQQMTNS